MTDLDTTPDLDINIDLDVDDITAAHHNAATNPPHPPELSKIIVDLIHLRAHHRDQATFHDDQATRIGLALRELHGYDPDWQYATPSRTPADPAQFAIVDAEPDRACVCGEPCTPDIVHRQDGPCHVIDEQPPAEPTTEPAAVVEPFTKPTGRAPRESRYDFEQIAMWIYTAKSNGTYTTAALAERFNVPTSTAKNWVGECRRRGLNVDPPAMTVDHPEQPGVTIPLTEIVATYLEATTAGRRPIQTIVDRYDVDRTVAQAWVNQCRDHRLLPSRDEPQVPAEAPQQYVHHTTKVVSL